MDETPTTKLPPPTHYATHTQLGELFDDMLGVVAHAKELRATIEVLAYDDPVHRLIGWSMEARNGDAIYSVAYTTTIQALKDAIVGRPRLRELLSSTKGRAAIAAQLTQGINPLTSSV